MGLVIMLFFFLPVQVYLCIWMSLGVSPLKTSWLTSYKLHVSDWIIRVLQERLQTQLPCFRHKRICPGTDINAFNIVKSSSVPKNQPPTQKSMKFILLQLHTFFFFFFSCDLMSSDFSSHSQPLCMLRVFLLLLYIWASRWN